IATAVAAGQAFELVVNDETLTLSEDDVLIESASAAGYSCAEDAGYLVGLDTAIDDALALEGLARELIRTVQEARKQAGLEVSDRITLGISGTSGVAAALDTYRDLIMNETLATQWQIGQTAPFAADGKLDSETWSIEISRL
ncbi:MAG: DUF5915 domain-containing protein, partial [Pseudomonadota bacterium]